MDAKYTKKAMVGDIIIPDEEKGIEYVVVRAELEGGGTGHGPHDIFPGGWHITARMLQEDGSYDPKMDVIEFYQSGCFTNMKEEVKIIDKMEQTYIRKNSDMTQISAQNVYEIKTQGDCEGKTTTTLGYAAGNKEDIREYFQDRKMYSLQLYEINIVQVQPGSVVRRNKLKEEKDGLEQRLKEIKDALQY